MHLLISLIRRASGAGYSLLQMAGLQLSYLLIQILLAIFR